MKNATDIVAILFLACIMFLIGAIYSNLSRSSNERAAPAHSSSPNSSGGLPVFMNVSAYCKNSCCCGKWSDGVTASGHVIKEGDKFVAASKSIPFGTMVIVDGYNNNRPVPVRDRGSAIKGNRLDTYHDTHQLALNWGRKQCKVWILETEL